MEKDLRSVWEVVAADLQHLNDPTTKQNFCYV